MKTAIPILLLFAFLFSACEREYYVEYSIRNSSNKKLLVTYKKQGQEIPDSNLIVGSLFFLIETGTGQKTEKYLDGLDALPLDFISVTDEEGNTPTYDVMDFENWRTTPPQSRGDIGVVYLPIYRWHFEE